MGRAVPDLDIAQLRLEEWVVLEWTEGRLDHVERKRRGDLRDLGVYHSYGLCKEREAGVRRFL
jgi:hypothetical protein